MASAEMLGFTGSAQPTALICAAYNAQCAARDQAIQNENNLNIQNTHAINTSCHTGIDNCIDARENQYQNCLGKEFESCAENERNEFLRHQDALNKIDEIYPSSPLNDMVCK